MAPMNNRLLRPTTGLDVATVAFRQASGATDVAAVDRLVKYLKLQSLWDYARFYPMKSVQNAGSGSTVYGLGGLTSNNMTLVNSATWGSDGVTFASASSQYASSSDFLSDGDPARTVFARCTLSGTHVDSSTRPILAHWEAISGRSTLLGYNFNDGRISLFRATDGTSSTTTRYDGSDTLFSGDICISAQWAASTRSLWANKTSVSLVLESGTPPTSTFDSSGNVTVANIDGGGASGGDLVDMSILLIVESAALSTTQRETITDLINAL